MRVRPWYEPQYIIPIAGMILGSAHDQRRAGRRPPSGDLRRPGPNEVEARLALGFSGHERSSPLVRAALRAAMIPTVNGMMTVGLVSSRA